MGHPAVFPIDLPAFFIKLLCPKGGLVIDPFAGSGSTGVAALQLGYDCLLIDNNEEYYQEAVQRVQNEGKVIPKRTAPRQIQVKQADLLQLTFPEHTTNGHHTNSESVDEELKSATHEPN